MATIIEANAPERLADASLKPRGAVFASPKTWRDQVLYFLLPDRFSDGSEGGRPLFDPANPAQHRAPDKRHWMAAGKRFQGGTIKGIENKLPYLQSLGVTTLWVGPIWKQRADLETYHGYGIQNFLEIDPRFGTRQDLRDLVDAAHARGMYVILDIIYNHSGNNWFYNINGQAQDSTDYRFAPPYPLHSFRSGTGASGQPIQGHEDGVWPEEFQNADWYTRAGKIDKWDPAPWEDPLHPLTEFRRGDFFGLKDLRNNEAEPGPFAEVLAALIKVYQYWIALSDCDGFRIDTVKHVSWEASRNFCGGIREFAEAIGKENFLLVGEVTGGGKMARDYLDIFGRNLDAALDLGDPAGRIAGLAKGGMAPKYFFDQFEGHDILGSHRETGRYHVSVLDDHDMVGRGGKNRFSAFNTIPAGHQQVAHAVGLQLTTLGIPCLYYGTEQAFDGTESRHDLNFEPLDHKGKIPDDDRYIREVMFGGEFGAFETAGCHFFNDSHPTYLRIAAIARVRGKDDAVGLALRRGRQYARETSFLDRPFALPEKGELVAWSRLHFSQEVLVAINTNGVSERGALVTVDATLHPVGSRMTICYSGAWSDPLLRNPPNDQSVGVLNVQGRAAVSITLPPAGMMILS